MVVHVAMACVVAISTSPRYLLERDCVMSSLSRGADRDAAVDWLTCLPLTVCDCLYHISYLRRWFTQFHPLECNIATNRDRIYLDLLMSASRPSIHPSIHAPILHVRHSHLFALLNLFCCVLPPCCVCW